VQSDDSDSESAGNCFVKREVIVRKQVGIRDG
jgi:hypothetical protein